MAKRSSSALPQSPNENLHVSVTPCDLVKINSIVGPLETWIISPSADIPCDNPPFVVSLLFLCSNEYKKIGYWIRKLERYGARELFNSILPLWVSSSGCENSQHE